MRETRILKFTNEVQAPNEHYSALRFIYGYRESFTNRECIGDSNDSRSLLRDVPSAHFGFPTSASSVPERGRGITAGAAIHVSYGPALFDKKRITGTPKIQFQILIPSPETHTRLTFSASARTSSVARGNENPHVGLKREAISANSSNIKQVQILVLCS
ncbi:hypothetical protein TNCV_924871 [Trichonephila clavipes]|nr:hypothetical protein TNCV_924871 [Trichonephila clavipes]